MKFDNWVRVVMEEELNHIRKIWMNQDFKLSIDCLKNTSDKTNPSH